MMKGARTVWALTLLATLPFAGAAWVMLAVGGVYVGPALLALLSWSAVTLSFLAGTRWGAAVTAPDPDGLMLTAAWLPAFAAWGLLAAPIADVRLQLGGFIVVFAAVLVWEIRALGPPGLAQRLTLVVAALLALAVGLAIMVML